jgi:hypothetical protein
MDDPKPAPRRLVLKAKEVIPLDGPSRPGDGTAISVDLMHRQNRLAEERAPGAVPADPPGPELPATVPGEAPIFKLKDVTPLDPPSSAGDEGAISVEGILRQNRFAAASAEPELIAMPVPRKSRRHREFVLILAVAVASVGGLMLVFRHDREMVALGLFGIVFLTLIRAWIMYGVMDRY